MKWLWAFFLFGSLMFLKTSFVYAIGEDSCECEKPQCGPCFEQEGLSFYTAKCAGGTKVKSCAKPSCVPLNPLPEGCAAQVNPQNNEMVATTQPTDSQPPTRGVASVSGPEVGLVKVIKGSVWLKEHKDGQPSQPLKIGQRVAEGAKIVTDKDSGVLVSLDDGNELHVGPSSELHLKKVDTSRADSKKAVIDLIKGKVRSKVKEKYKGANSFYHIRTKAAVAGVRGTDFVVSYTQADRVVMKVETIQGEVELFDHSREQKVNVPAGTYSSYVVAANDSKLFTDEEISEFVARGYFTPVYKISAQDLKVLNETTDLENLASSGRAMLAKDKKIEAPDYICSEPAGQLNSCSWTCENNPKGSTRCQTQRPEVHCIRRRCNANGQWTEQTRLPASYHDACPPDKVRVGPCDY